MVSVDAPAEKGNFIARALQHLQGVAPALGLTPGQPNEFVPDPQTQTTSSGATVVHLQQNYKSIPIFQAAQTVDFTPDGAIDQAVGTTVTVAPEVPVSPNLRVEDAALKAGQFLATPQPADQTERDSFGQLLSAPKISVDECWDIFRDAELAGALRKHFQEEQLQGMIELLTGKLHPPTANRPDLVQIQSAVM